RGRHARWRGELSGAGADRGRRGQALRCGARRRRTSRALGSAARESEIIMTDKLDLDHLRQWIGRTSEASDVVTAHLVQGLRATLFQEVGEPKAGDAAP